MGELRERVRGAEAGVLAYGDGAEPIVGQSPALLHEIGIADGAAPTDMPVLICGPTGVGKELFARRIHRRSLRAAGPFVPINCASIPENLLESELFGVERGAYTGADRSRAGFFEKASEGTLFLDEIGDLPLTLQPKLLRVLEEKRLSPLGSTRQRPVDVRILAATNQNILERIGQGRFREDLYYRLAPVVVHIAPLSERGEDVLLLANYYLQVANREFGKSVRGFEEGAVVRLRRHPWPGNVRQLQGLVKQMVLMADGPVITEGLVERIFQRHQIGGPAPPTSSWNLPLGEAKEAFEKEYLGRRLAGYRGSVSALARELGITRPNLYIKMKRWGLKVGGE